MGDRLENRPIKTLKLAESSGIFGQNYAKNGGGRRGERVEMAEQPNHRLLFRRLANFNKFRNRFLVRETDEQEGRYILRLAPTRGGCS